MDSRELKITASTCSYGNLNIRCCGSDFFPKDVFGSSSKKTGLGVPIILNIEGLERPIKTDIPTGKETGKPRWIFRERAWVKEFVSKNMLIPGSIITITRLGKRLYDVSPGNNGGKQFSEGTGRMISKAFKRSDVRTGSQHVSKTNNKKLLKLGFAKTCNCKENHINCLSAKDWLKSQLGVWQFSYERRDIRDKQIHPATFPISLARKVIELFSHEGELVLDPFVGSGTTLIAANDLNRNSVGFDLQASYIYTIEDR